LKEAVKMNEMKVLGYLIELKCTESKLESTVIEGLCTENVMICAEKIYNKL